MSAANTGQPISIPTGAVFLEGALDIPASATGVVIFSHGSGSGRLSPRNQFVASRLRERGLGTLLLDLLTEAEERDYERRFDIALLTQRLAHAVHFVRDNAATAAIPIGLTILSLITLPVGLEGTSMGSKLLLGTGLLKR